MALAAKGVPVVLFVSEVFVPMVTAQLGSQGQAGVTVSVMPHPFGTIDTQGLRKIASNALTECDELLTQLGWQSAGRRDDAEAR